jgi:hypothetical protein
MMQGTFDLRSARRSGSVKHVHLVRDVFRNVEILQPKVFIEIDQRDIAAAMFVESDDFQYFVQISRVARPAAAPLPSAGK